MNFTINRVISLILLGGGRAVSAINRLFDLEAPASPLNKFQIAELKKVFADSIDYRRVEIKAGNSGLLSVTGRAFTLANTIYIPAEKFPLALLVHEMAHIWQNQHGGINYISKAL